MIKYTDIKSAVNLKLKENYSEVRRPETNIEGGFEKPAFFVELIPVSEKNYNEYSEKLVMINIIYFPKNKKNLDLLKMLDSLSSVFINTLKINDRIVTLSEKKYSIANNVLQFKFNLDIIDGLEQVEINGEYITKTELDEELGYTEDTLVTMKELELSEEV